MDARQATATVLRRQRAILVALVRRIDSEIRRAQREQDRGRRSRHDALTSHTARRRARKNEAVLRGR